MLHRYHAVIIGGGFSGTALAIHLVRRGRRPLRVTLVEARERLGRGVAYGTNVDEHVLNTRPDAMSLFSDSPERFATWLDACGIHAADSEFVPRSVYGDYLEDSLIEALNDDSEQKPESRVVFQAHTQTRAMSVVRRSGTFEVALEDGTSLSADTVVLATGNPGPADPLAFRCMADSRRYLRNAWDQTRIEDVWPTDRVLILGTGLTMIDVVVSLHRQGHIGSVQAMSRRGLLPRAHEAVLSELPPDLRDGLRAAVVSASLSGSLPAIVRAVRRSIRQAAERGVGWHAVFDALRPITADLWKSLAGEERARFLRHVRPFWEVHRHRLAPGTARTIAGLQRAGKLAVSAGRVCRALATDKAIFVDCEIRGADRIRHDRFDWVINCTSPSFHLHESALHGQLIADGLLTPDPLGLGYATAGNGAAIGVNGRIEGLYLLGPACKARLWEQTAVPELRKQAERLATEILASQSRRQRRKTGCYGAAAAFVSRIQSSTWRSRTSSVTPPSSSTTS